MESFSTLREFVKHLGETFYTERPFIRAAAQPRQAYLVLLILVALLSLPGFIRLVVVMNEVKQEYVDPAIYKLPVMEVINGRVRSTVKQPYRIVLNGDLLFVLDTTGTIKNLRDSGAWAFMGQDYLALYNDGERSDIRRFDLSSTDYLMVDPISVKSTIDGIYPFIYPFILLFTVAGFYIFRLVQALLAAGVAFVMLNLQRKRIGFDILTAIAVYALIPAMCTEMVLNLIGIYFPGRGWLLIILIAVYMWRGVRACLGGAVSERE